ncbi:MAG: hypothetical protein INH41_25495 [Myxococcaceae bacterium]|jgi:alpha-tubulin suppressor-like RCC1 family protein|nr:hypothetical protein [Myxococcaceae bacterium]
MTQRLTLPSWRSFALLGLLGVGALAACGTTQQPRCTPTTCWGCCDKDDVCRTGFDGLFCGTRGAACTACTSGFVCGAGVCRVAPSLDAGAGGGAAGGFDAGAAGGAPVEDAGPPRPPADAGTRCTDGCTGATPVCDSATNLCVGCTSNVHCFGQTPYCNATTKTCAACSPTQGCRAPTPHCDTRGAARCVACLVDTHCDPAAPLCDPGTRACVTCTVGRGCGGALPVCDVFTPGGRCVECLADSHCSEPTPFCDTLLRTCRADPVLRGSLVAAGGAFSCGVSDGGVKCWGANSSGQLGDGNLIMRSAAVDVASLPADAFDVSAGASHACARTAGSRGLRCWGSNSSGQLGDGTTTNRGLAADVPNLPDVVAMDVGQSHTCALTTQGGAKCWGLNTSGQLGDGSTTTRTTPVDVSGLGAGLIALSAGGSHSCALTAAGGVKCWGSNASGQLGDGSTSTRPAPVDVSGLVSGVVALAAGGNHSCALLSTGGVKCWGFNGSGQLGSGLISSSNVPVDVIGLVGAVSLTAGDSHTCALLMDGTMRCWGSGSSGQLGIGTISSSISPVAVTQLPSDVIAISAGGSHTCVRTATGSARCWGRNFDGQCGNGSTFPSSVTTPSVVQGF